jgi:3'-phosphoadenosine 5'-phosphosulfate sulfotransferase (PAPS reductase)/FAD synthetase
VKRIVGFSGGIDSQEAAARVIERFGPEDTILLNSSAGNWEDPLTIQFVLDYSRDVHPVITIDAIFADMWETPGFAETRGFDSNATLTFEAMVRVKGRSPSRTAQFCTHALKLKPQRRWTREQFGIGGQFEGEEYERYTGVRRDESHARKDYPDTEWDDFFDCQVSHIIVGLTKGECFEGARRRGEAINPLYLMGFGRVGCAPCVNSGKEDVLNWDSRRPQAITKVRGLETRTGRTFFPPMVPGLPINNIDQVIEWAKTSRGGRQQLFPILHERESCESKYGLCE